MLFPYWIFKKGTEEKPLTQEFICSGTNSYFLNSQFPESQSCEFSVLIQNSSSSQQNFTLDYLSGEAEIELLMDTPLNFSLNKGQQITLESILSEYQLWNSKVLNYQITLLSGELQVQVKNPKEHTLEKEFWIAFQENESHGFSFSVPVGHQKLLLLFGQQEETKVQVRVTPSKLPAESLREFKFQSFSDLFWQKPDSKEFSYVQRYLVQSSAMD